jgi:hypothetical protein
MTVHTRDHERGNQQHAKQRQLVRGSQRGHRRSASPAMTASCWIAWTASCPVTVRDG